MNILQKTVLLWRPLMYGYRGAVCCVDMWWRQLIGQNVRRTATGIEKKKYGLPCLHDTDN